MLLLQAIRKALLTRHKLLLGTREPAQGRLEGTHKPLGLIIADLMADIGFFIGFLCYPGSSTTILMFFMSETFDGPGEESLTVMRYDRSIETDSGLYRAFIPYALVMMAIFPIG
eukprot:7386223-Prymnesium_polylepis.2